MAPTPAGAVRRARALVARGWTPQAIEHAAGVPARECRKALENRIRLSAEAATRIAAAYEQLWDRQPQDSPPDAADYADRARRWAPPMAWDDDVIDLPQGRPEDGWKPGTGTRQRAADLVEDADFVREHGGYRHAPVGEVALRLGVTRTALEKALERTRTAQREAVLDREAG
jgi:hypothetical protein